MNPLVEVDTILELFLEELRKPLGDGKSKLDRGDKPPWYSDPDHEPAVFSHITKWKKGELVDPDSGAHPLVHGACRMLMIALQEMGYGRPLEYDPADGFA